MDAPKTTITLVIRPIDTDGWVMGPDEEVAFPYETTLIDVKKSICAKRPHISVHRVLLLFNLKPMPENKHSWTIRKLGAYDGTIITFKTTYLRAWYILHSLSHIGFESTFE